jgi:hypothetical protein
MDGDDIIFMILSCRTVPLSSLQRDEAINHKDGRLARWNGGADEELRMDGGGWWGTEAPKENPRAGGKF